MSERDQLIGANNPPQYSYAYGQPPPYNPEMAPPSHRPPPYQPTHTTVIVHQQPAVVAALALPNPPDYMGYAICATICFFPLGIVAIMMSNRVRENIHRGNISEAYRNANAVRVLYRVAWICGVCVYVGIILGVVLPLTVNGSDDDDNDYDN